MMPIPSQFYSFSYGPSWRISEVNGSPGWIPFVYETNMLLRMLDFILSGWMIMGLLEVRVKY